MLDSTRRALAVDNAWISGQPVAEWAGGHLPADFVPRRVRVHPDERAALVVGPRQAGKSTLVWRTLADADRPALFIDCQEPAIREWLTSPAMFLDDVRELVPPEAGLFFEEFQDLANAGRFLKGVVDRRPQRPIYVTGSSSFDLEDATRESLAGRAQRVVLLPYSFAELAAVTPAPPLLAPDVRQKLLHEMLLHGSYPRVHASPVPEDELAQHIEAFVIRDASDRFRIRHVAAFRRVLELVASQLGNLVRFSEWSATAGVSNDTVADYAALLENTHVIRLLRPFVGGKRAELTHAPKAFLVDNGIRNAVFGGFAPVHGRSDRGSLMESFVFSELAKSTNPLLHGIHYWRSKGGAEVDFVVTHRGRLLGCEVKYGDARGRLTRSARSFLSAYGPDVFLVVHRGEPQDRQEGATSLRFVGAADVAAHVQEFVNG